MRKEDLKFFLNMLVMLCNDDRTHFRGLVNVLQTMFLYIANATNVFLSSILDIP